MKKAAFYLMVSILFACSLVVVPPVRAQSGGAESVYKNQLISLYAGVDSLLRNIDKVGTHRTAVINGLFATLKLVHRLGEESSQSDLDATKAGANSSKELLMVSQTCAVLDFIITSMTNYLWTSDRSFILLARQGNELAKSSIQAM